MGAWLIPSPKLELREDEIHVWRRRRVISGSTGPRAGGGTLSRLLSLYTGQPEKSIQLAKSEHGKPFLPDSDLQFNLSHSVDLALYAFARGRDVGVDVERESRKVKAIEIAERFFSESEREYLRQLPEEQLPVAFLRTWTRKEALLKALGTGIAGGLSRFSVAPEVERAFDLPVPGAPEWSLWDLPAGEGYAGALVSRPSPVRLRLFHCAG